tara:strand:- start:1691 stop:1849 length:159 start_codon:yes stop_codon:yes gene_type:complete
MNDTGKKERKKERKKKRERERDTQRDSFMMHPLKSGTVHVCVPTFLKKKAPT